MLAIAGILFVLALLCWFCDLFVDDARINFVIPMRLFLIAAAILIVWNIVKKNPAAPAKANPETKVTTEK